MERRDWEGVGEEERERVRGRVGEGGGSMQRRDGKGEEGRGWENGEGVEVRRRTLYRYRILTLSSACIHISTGRKCAPNNNNNEAWLILDNTPLTGSAPHLEL